jgi:hypothetical protein
MTEDDFNVVKMGGPPRLAWKNDFRDSGLLSAYLHDYQRFENSEPLRARRALQMKGILPFNDMFGAMCLLFALARGTSSLAIEFLEDGFSDLQGKSTKDTDLPFLAFQSSSSRSATALAGLEKLMSRPWVRLLTSSLYCLDLISSVEPHLGHTRNCFGEERHNTLRDVIRAMENVR